MKGVRRSGRIPREIPIVILGTNTLGRVFSEETHTIVLSLHGAGILSRNKFAPDEVLTLRLSDSGREAEIRLVGDLGEDPRGGHVYGVAFCDPELDFWQIEFPPPLQHDLHAASVSLECRFCGSRCVVQHSEVEADVFLVSESVLRYCESCGQTTPWKQASGEAVPPEVAPSPPPPRDLPPPPSAPVIAVAPVLPEQSAYGAGVLDDLVSDNFTPMQPAAKSVTAGVQKPQPKSKPAEAPAVSAGGKPNRRRHVRTRVNFKACVRMNHLNEDIVECENVSKGGLCFRSRKRYPEGASIEVAVPYYPGQQAIFVAAQICHVEELWGDLYRYGVAYT